MGDGRTVPATSRHAYERRPVNEETTRRILLAASNQPRSSRQLAAALNHDYMDLEKRCSDLLDRGCLRKGDKTLNEDTNRPAHKLHITPAGRHVLAGGPVPERPQPLATIRARILDAARAPAESPITGDELAAALESLGTSPDDAQAAAKAWGELQDCHAAVQDRRKKHMAPTTEGIPIYDARRERLAKKGQWLRSDGTTIPKTEMADAHLINAYRQVRTAGLEDRAIARMLRSELTYRGLAAGIAKDGAPKGKPVNINDLEELEPPDESRLPVHYDSESRVKDGA